MGEKPVGLGGGVPGGDVVSEAAKERRVMTPRGECPCGGKGVRKTGSCWACQRCLDIEARLKTGNRRESQLANGQYVRGVAPGRRAGLNGSGYEVEA
jgi:hypothetical protein